MNPLERLVTTILRRLGVPVDVDPDEGEALILACRDALLGPLEPAEEAP